VAFAASHLLQLCRFVHVLPCLRGALPPALGSQLLASRRAGLLRVVEGLVLLEGLVLGHEDSARRRRHDVHVGNGSHVVSDQTRRFAL